MKTIYLSFASALIMLMMSCGESRQTDQAELGEVQDTPEYAGEATYVVDTEESELQWEGEKRFVNWGHKGTIRIQSGEIWTSGENITGGTFLIDMTTIENEDLVDKPEDKAKLEGHLRSDDFFAVDQYPTSKFEITNVEYVEEEGGNNARVSGNFTIRDQTHNITFPARLEVDEETATAEAEFNINRADFNVKFGSEKWNPGIGRDDIIKDEIHLNLDITARRTDATARN